MTVFLDDLLLCLQCGKYSRERNTDNEDLIPLKENRFTIDYGALSAVIESRKDIPKYVVRECPTGWRILRSGECFCRINPLASTKEPQGVIARGYFARRLLRFFLL